VSEKRYKALWQGYLDGEICEAEWNSILYEDKDFRNWIADKEGLPMVSGGGKDSIEWLAEQNIKLYRRYIRSGLFTQEQAVKLVASHGYKL